MHQGGFYRFSYDITDLLKPGKKNLLEVKIAKESANKSINAAERKATGGCMVVFTDLYGWKLSRQSTCDILF